MTAIIVSSGQTGSGATIRSGDQLIVLPGGSAAGVVNSGGSVISAGSVVVLDGMLVSSASGALSGAAVGSGGREFVLPSGIGNGTAVGAGGAEDVFSGGYSTATVVFAGGMQRVQSGGFSIGATASPGGGIAVSAGGTASAAAVGGGTLTVTGSGAVAAGAVAGSGATVFVQSGGVARGLSAAPGSTVVVQSGGVLISGGVGGTTLVSAGGVVSGVGLGGRTTVLSGGVVSSGSVGGALDIQAGGVALGASVGPGGVVTVLSGGVVSGLTVSSTSRYGAGQAIVSSGGIARATVANGALIVDGGTSEATSASTTGLGIAAVEIVKNGGRTSGTIGYQTVSSGGVSVDTLAFAQNVLAGGVASGTVIRGGTQTVGSGGAAYGTVIGDAGFPGSSYFGAGSVQAVGSGGVAVGTVVSLGGIQSIAPGGAAAGTTLLAGGTIRLAGTPYFAGGRADYDAGTHMLAVAEGAYSAALELSGDYAGEFFHLADNGAGGTDITVDGTPCFCHGTAILTERGEVAVESLAIGDRVVTASGRAQRVRWLGRRSYAGRLAARNPDIMPVMIRAGALGGGLPRRDLRVSPLHAMALEGVLVPAAALVDGMGIVQPSRAERVDYVHIELDSHDIVLAEGAASESFIDDDSRAMFHNAAEYRMLYPDAPRPEPRYCLPRVEFGEQLARVRRSLARPSLARLGHAA